VTTSVTDGSDLTVLPIVGKDGCGETGSAFREPSSLQKLFGLQIHLCGKWILRRTITH
jgi:hypothetical protein